MSDLQDMDTSDLDEMDEDDSGKDTDTQPSDTEASSAVLVQPAGTEARSTIPVQDKRDTLAPSMSDVSKTAKENIDKGTKPKSLIPGTKELDQHVSDINKTIRDSVSKGAKLKSLTTDKRELDQHVSDISKRTKDSIDKGAKPKSYTTERKQLDQPAVSKVLPERNSEKAQFDTKATKHIEKSGAEQVLHQKSTDQKEADQQGMETPVINSYQNCLHKTSDLCKETKGKVTEKPVQKLYFGTEQESSVFIQEVEELISKDKETEISGFEIPENIRNTVRVDETDHGVKVLSHDEEIDTVIYRPFVQEFRADKKPDRFQVEDYSRSSKTGSQRAEKFDIDYVGQEKGQYTADTEPFVDINLGSTFTQDADVDSGVKFEKDTDTCVNEEIKSDEAEAKLMTSLMVDETDAGIPVISKSKVRWDDNRFLEVLDTDDNIMIEEPVCSKSWNDSKFLEALDAKDTNLVEDSVYSKSWNDNKFLEVLDAEDNVLTTKPVYSQSWREEIIYWNLRDFDVSAVEEIIPQTFLDMSGNNDVVEKKGESDQMIQTVVVNYSSSLSDKIIVSVFETLTGDYQNLEQKLTSNTEKESCPENETGNYAKDTEECYAKTTDVYSCDSYSDFCRELEASGSNNKVGTGISFEEGNEESISFDDKTDDELLKIQICEPGDSEMDQNEEFEKFMHDRYDSAPSEIKEESAIKENQAANEAVEYRSEICELESDFAQANVMEILEPESLHSLEYCEGMVLNTGLSEDQEYHEIMAALANEEYGIDDQEFLAGTAQDYGLVPGSDIEEGAGSLEYCDWNIAEEECK